MALSLFSLSNMLNRSRNTDVATQTDTVAQKFNPENISRDTFLRVMDAFAQNPDDRLHAGIQASQNFTSYLGDEISKRNDKKIFTEKLYESLQKEILDENGNPRFNFIQAFDKTGIFTIGNHTYIWVVDVGTGTWSGSDGIGIRITHKNTQQSYTVPFRLYNSNH